MQLNRKISLAVSASKARFSSPLRPPQEKQVVHHTLQYQDQDLGQEDLQGTDVNPITLTILSSSPDKVLTPIVSTQPDDYQMLLELLW